MRVPVRATTGPPRGAIQAQNPGYRRARLSAETATLHATPVTQRRRTQMAATAEESSGATSIRPFTVEISEAEVEDLRARIAATRLPEKETVEDASQGVQLATMEALVRYWGSKYDLMRVETRLNA